MLALRQGRLAFFNLCARWWDFTYYGSLRAKFDSVGLAPYRQIKNFCFLFLFSSLCFHSENLLLIFELTGAQLLTASDLLLDQSFMIGCPRRFSGKECGEDSFHLLDLCVHRVQLLNFLYLASLSHNGFCHEDFLGHFRLNFSILLFFYIFRRRLLDWLLLRLNLLDECQLSPQDDVHPLRPVILLAKKLAGFYLLEN